MNSYVIRRIASATLIHETETEETYNHQHGLDEGDLATPRVKSAEGTTHETSKVDFTNEAAFFAVVPVS
jgi:hypothetical protein